MRVHTRHLKWIQIANPNVSRFCMVQIRNCRKFSPANRRHHNWNLFTKLHIGSYNRFYWSERLDHEASISQYSLIWFNLIQRCPLMFIIMLVTLPNCNGIVSGVTLFIQNIKQKMTDHIASALEQRLLLWLSTLSPQQGTVANNL